MDTLLVLTPHKALSEALTDELPGCTILTAENWQAAATLLPQAHMLVMDKAEFKTLAPDFCALPVIVCTRPLKLRELLYTINARLQALSTESLALLEHWMYSPRERILASADLTVSLTEKEAALFVSLLENIGNSLQREQLLSDIWGYNEAVDSHTLETHIYRLRTKLKQVEITYDIVATDEGYRLSII